MSPTELERRGFLRLAAAPLSLSLLEAPRAAAAQLAPANEPAAADVMDKLSGYLARSADAELPGEVVEKAKHHVLDTLTAMLSGAELDVGRLARAFASGQAGVREAQVAGSGLVTTAIDAALANGTMAHADETDDSHEPSGTHPGCAIVPAALAAAERQGASGKSFLNAVVAGYDVGCRINLALDRELLNASNHSTHAIGGVFGAAAAAASVLRLDETRVRFVMDYAGQQASGVRYWVRDREHVEKAFVFGGMPARNGVTAALLVASGFTGVSDCFSGENNFLDTFSTAPRPGLLVEGLGRRFEVMATNIKKYPVGSPIQAPLEALTILIERHRLTAAEVKAIVVRMPSKRTVDDREMPDINLQYILAVTLLDGRLSFEAAHSYARMNDPAVLRVKARLSVVEDSALRRPHTSRTGICEVTLHDGTTLSEHVTAVPGTAERPMTAREVERKCVEILAPVIGTQRTEKLVAAVRSLERLGDVRALRPLLASA